MSRNRLDALLEGAGRLTMVEQRRESHIRQFCHSRLVHEDVCGFEATMSNAQAMQVSQAMSNIQSDRLAMFPLFTQEFVSFMANFCR